MASHKRWVPGMYVCVGMLVMLCACGDDDAESSTCEASGGCDAAVAFMGGTGGAVGSSANGGAALEDRRDEFDDGFSRGGEALSLCTNDTHCQAPLECHEGGHFCTPTCDDDMDCAEGYTCYQQGGVCRLECESVDDDSCPGELLCQEKGENAFRCVYPDLPPMGSGDREVFERCTPGDCLPDLKCFIDGNAEAGFCTAQCAENKDCDELDAGGLKIECSKPHGLCNVECNLDQDGACPGDTTCVMNATKEPLGEQSCHAT